MIEKRLLTREETQEILHIGRTKFYALCKTADFPTVRIGTKILVDYNALVGTWIPNKSATSIRGVRK